MPYSELLDIQLFEGPHSLVLKVFQAPTMWFPVEHLFPRTGTPDRRSSTEEEDHRPRT